MVKTSLGLLQKSSAIFRNLRKIYGIVHVTFRQVLENLRKIFAKGPKIFGKSSKTLSSVCLYNKEIIASHGKNIEPLSCLLLPLVRLLLIILFLPLEHKIHIFSPPCNILYIQAHQGFIKGWALFKLTGYKNGVVCPGLTKFSRRVILI